MHETIISYVSNIKDCKLICQNKDDWGDGKEQSRLAPIHPLSFRAKQI